MDDIILDADLIKNQSRSLIELVSWWEKKRLIYNLIVFGIVMILILYFWKGTLQFGIGNAIIGSLAYLIVANIFFSIGWGIDVLVHYYNLKFLKTLTSFRMLFFILGVLFSILLTIVLYADTLFYY